MRIQSIHSNAPACQSNLPSQKQRVRFILKGFVGFLVGMRVLSCRRWKVGGESKRTKRDEWNKEGMQKDEKVGWRMKDGWNWRSQRVPLFCSYIAKLKEETQCSAPDHPLQCLRNKRDMSSVFYSMRHYRGSTPCCLLNKEEQVLEESITTMALTGEFAWLIMNCLSLS